ncbi:MAG: ABC transporter ATP-binding protein [Acutalibacteraceae bacterium]
MKTIDKIKKYLNHKEIKNILHSWSWIFSYILKYKGQVIAFSCIGLLSTAMGLFSSWVLKDLIDSVTGQISMAIAPVAAVYIGTAVAKIFITALTNRLSLQIKLNVGIRIKNDVYDRLMNTEWTAISAFHSADIMTRTGTDVGIVSNMVLSYIPNAVTALVNFIGAFFIILHYDPLMALIALAGAPVTVLTAKFRLGKATEFQKKNRELAGERLAIEEESYQNLQTIKSFGLVEVFSRRFKEFQKKGFGVAMEQNRYQNQMMIVMSLMGQLVTYSCYGFALYRLWSGSITFGTLSLFMSMAASLTGSFSSVVSLVPSFIRAGISAGRVLDILELPKEETELTPQEKEFIKNSKDQKLTLKLDNITCAYNDKAYVYKNSCMEAQSGKITALIGASGKGKTSTLRLLLGLIKPKDGKITVSNESGEQIALSASTRELFSYVPQNNTIFSGTIAENLRLVKQDATDEELEKVLRDACAWEFVSKLPDAMNTTVTERGQCFSDGQNQRLSIARALLADTPILLLDEATSALDVATEKEVLSNILRNNRNRMIILTSHKPSVFNLSDVIYSVSENGIELLDKKDLPNE